MTITTDQIISIWRIISVVKAPSAFLPATTIRYA